MRKATGKYYTGNPGKYESVTGYFHQWAAQYEEFESGPGNRTVALIEDEQTGKIRECFPETVAFIEGVKP